MLYRNYCCRQILTILFIFNLTACGYQLRGETSKFIISAEWKKLALRSANPRDELTRQVTLVFRSAGVEWSPISSANYVLSLASPNLTQRVQSLNSQARPSEIDLTLTLHISIFDKEGKEILPETGMVVRRRINNNPLNATGVNEEIRLTTSEMQRQLAENLLRRVSTLTHSIGKN